MVNHSEVTFITEGECCVELYNKKTCFRQEYSEPVVLFVKYCCTNDFFFLLLLNKMWLTDLVALLFSFFLFAMYFSWNTESRFQMLLKHINTRKKNIYRIFFCCRWIDEIPCINKLSSKWIPKNNFFPLSLLQGNERHKALYANVWKKNCFFSPSLFKM